MPFSFTKEEWDKQRHFFMGTSMNGIAPPILDAINKNYEPLIESIQKLKLMAEAGPLKRSLLETLLVKVLDGRRQ